jgi:ribonuclease J
MVPPLRVIPLGGLGEIGKNMLALEVGDDIVVIDAGVMFPGEGLGGVDLVIPDISYLLQRKEKVRGILITHGHEDHIGALPNHHPRLPVPVYAVGLAHGLIGVKLQEHHISPRLLQRVEPLRPIRLGRLKAEFFPVCHSIPDAMGIALETPSGLVLHTGDFKIDHTPVHGNPTDFSILASYARRGVFLLLSDSTYAETPGYTPSERVLNESLDHIIGEAPGRVMVATFASLISRVQQVLDAAAKHRRKVAVVGRSMVENVEMAVKMGYIKPAEGVLQPWSAIRPLPPHQVVLITTGTQGEPTSALVRIANREHREIEVIPGDTIVVSASPIPGNETLINRTIDNLCRQGARVLYHRNALVHVHGHAAQEELKLVLRLLRPRYFVPVHGEYRHLVAHAHLAISMGVAPENTFVLEDGEVLELTPEGGRKGGRIPCSTLYVDGQRLWEEGSVVLRERHLLAREGVVVLVLPVARETGRLARPPEITSSGFLEPEEARAVLSRAATALQDALDSRPLSPVDQGLLSAKAKEVLEGFLYQETRRRPLVLPVVVTV